MTEQDQNQDESCPECGAPRVDGMTCWEQLGAIGAWEFQNPDLWAEHFLTVASYNLQHPAKFTKAALSGLRTAFIERLDQGISTEVIRRRAAAAYNGKRRVLKDEAERQSNLRHWQMTIADVYIPNHPEGAVGWVKKWAAAIRQEL